MKTLDRYIVGQFVINYGVLLCVGMLLIVTVDFIVGLDEFIQAGQAFAERYGGMLPATFVTIGDYYGPLLTLMYVFISGLIVVAAAGFTLTSLQRSRELTAMVASGISLYRVAAPIIVAGIALNALSLPVQELIIPRFAAELTRSKSQLKYGQSARFEVQFARDGAGNLLHANEFDAEAATLQDVSILVRDEQGLAVRHITAPTAVWDEQRSGWRLEPMGEAVEPRTQGRQIGLSGAQPVGFFETDLSPRVLLAQRGSVHLLLSLAQLRELQNNPAVEPRERAQVTRTIWSRFSLLVLNVLILVMGLPFFLQLGQVNPVLQAVKAVGVVMPAWGGGVAMLMVSLNLINPVADAWLPVVMYLPLSAGLLQLVRT